MITSPLNINGDQIKTLITMLKQMVPNPTIKMSEITKCNMLNIILYTCTLYIYNIRKLNPGTKY